MGVCFLWGLLASHHQWKEQQALQAEPTQPGRSPGPTSSGQMAQTGTKSKRKSVKQKQPYYHFSWLLSACRLTLGKLLNPSDLLIVQL